MRKRLLFMLSLTTVLFSCTKVMETDPQGDVAEVVTTKAGVKETVFTAYDFCNKEGFWANLGPLEERIEATQIPAEKLSGYSTEELFILCLNNPLTLLYPAYNNELVAVDVVADRLNVFQALESREDAANAILDVYSDAVIDVEQKATNCLYRNGKYSFSLLSANFISLYIASARIPSLFEGENAARLKTCAERLYEMKKANPEVFSWFSFSKEIVLLEVMKGGHAVSPAAAKKIYSSIREVKVATKSYEDDFDYNTDEMWSSIQTPYGQNVTVIAKGEFSFSERNRVDSYFLSLYNYPGNDSARSSSRTYNCHFFAWHLNDNPNYPTMYWMNRENYFDEISLTYGNISKYWTNDYYTEVYSESQADIVLYGASDHSAVRLYAGRYKSKWGEGPLMEHSPSNCPYLVSEMRYFKEDQIIPDPPPPPIIPSVNEVYIYSDNAERVGSVVNYALYTIPSNTVVISWSLYKMVNGSYEFLERSIGNMFSVFYDSMGEYRVDVSLTDASGFPVGRGSKEVNIIR